MIRRIKIEGVSLRVAISLFFAVSILVVSLQLSRQKQGLNRLASGGPIYPLEVRVANQNDTSFSVAWVTKEAINQFVVYGENPDGVASKDYLSPGKTDDKGEGNYYAHLVTIDNLEVGKNYYFKIVDADYQYLQNLDSEWREIGIAGIVTLPHNPGHNIGSFSLETKSFDGCNTLPEGNLTYCFRPNPVWGQLRQPNNQTAEDALVFIEIPGQSNTLVTKTNDDGDWTIDLSNFWRNDGSDRLGYTPGIDLIKVTALARDLAVSTYRQISPVGTGEPQKTSPILLTLQNAPLVVRENTPTPTPTPTPTQTPTATPIPTSQITPVSPNQINFDITTNLKNVDQFTAKIRLKNNSGRQQNWTVSFGRRYSDGNHYLGTISFPQAGEYEITIKPEGYLSTSLGKYTLKPGINQVTADGSAWTAGDLNGDDEINALDLSILISKYGESETKKITGVDLNADGIINIIDLSLLIDNYHEG